MALEHNIFEPLLNTINTEADVVSKSVRVPKKKVMVVNESSAPVDAIEEINEEILLEEDKVNLA